MDQTTLSAEPALESTPIHQTNCDKDSKTYQHSISDEKFDVKVIIDTDSTVFVEMKHSTDKSFFSWRKTAKEVIQMTNKAGVELQSPDFFDILKSAFCGDDETINLIEQKLIPKDQIQLKIEWKIGTKTITKARIFELELQHIERKDIERMAEVLDDMEEIRTDVKNKTSEQIVQIAELKNGLVELESKSNSKLDNFIAEMRPKIDGINGKLNGIEDEIKKIKTNVGAVETNIDAVKAKVGVIEPKVCTLDSKVEIIEIKIDKQSKPIDEQPKPIDKQPKPK